MAAQGVLNLLGMRVLSTDFVSKDSALVIQHVRSLLARLVLFCILPLVSLSVSCPLLFFMFETLCSGLTSLSATPPGFQVTDADSWPQTCPGDLCRACWGDGPQPSLQLQARPRIAGPSMPGPATDATTVSAGGSSDVLNFWGVSLRKFHFF